MLHCGPFFYSVMSAQANQNQSELTRRHRTTVLLVRILLALVLALVAAAFLSRGRLRQQENPGLDIAVRVMILIFGLGSVVIRRTRFSAMRLQDITALRGVSGLLQTLQKTTTQVAILGAFVAVCGFVATLITGNDFYAYGAGLVGIVVLIYCYPTKTSWQQTVNKFADDGGSTTSSTNTPSQE
ncbi:MAG TPA: hypothetical protein VGN86_14860 [Pyrinomonadaceae bacterium]|jgi:hypothetical protein|nr:hypothetical protein [Pyrinomonadaceae bacterium]